MKVYVTKYALTAVVYFNVDTIAEVAYGLLDRVDHIIGYEP